MSAFGFTHTIVAAVILLTTATSCIYDNLPECRPEKVTLTIINDWTAAPDADPEGMAYLFFRDDISSPWRFDFPGRQGGEVTLEEGRYRFVMYNDDTADILFGDGDNGLPFVTTPEGTLTIDSLDIGVHKSPDMMWSASISKVNITPAGVEYGEPEVAHTTHDPFAIMTEPRQITPVYTLLVHHVGNLIGVTAMKGVIAGMASGTDLYDLTTSANSVNVPFTPDIAPDSTLTARFCTFGLPSGSAPHSELTLYFILSDARMISRTIDVTAQITTAPDPLNVKLVIDSISLPYAPPTVGGGAFDPSVKDWTTIHIYYNT